MKACLAHHALDLAQRLLGREAAGLQACSVCTAAMSPWCRPSVSCAWSQRLARRSHSVVEIDVPMAPAVMRMKLDRPEAEGMRSGVISDSVIVTSGMRRTPWRCPG